MADRLTLELEDDPVGIIALLPARWHRQFLSEYRDALTAAHEVERFQELVALLRLWRLRAAAYSKPEFDRAEGAVRENRDEEFVPANQIPGWPTV